MFFPQLANAMLLHFAHKLRNTAASSNVSSEQYQRLRGKE
jgi:hypothetical protein